MRERTMSPKIRFSSINRLMVLMLITTVALLLFPRPTHADSVPLYSFNGSDGAYPYAGLVQGSDGNFYGTTGGGGTNGAGTVFRITSGGSLTTLYNFCGGDGANPYAGLVQGSDGDFYGTTLAGGNFYGTTCGYGCSLEGFGTVFKITSGGRLTTLHSFNGSDGARPFAGLVQGGGHFYGTTFSGGSIAGNAGTVFKITSGGSFTTLYNFSYYDGAFPYAGLVQGSDGNFYGTTSEDDSVSGPIYGTVFKITLPSNTVPTNKDQCKNGGWATFTSPRTFKNEGDCIQFVNTGK